MAESPARRPTRDDQTVSRIIGQLRHRFPAFHRAHIEDLKHMSHDTVARMVSEYIVLGQKSAFESFLQRMLTAEEQDRLHSDQEFTVAWRVFVDMCWAKKQLKRAGLILLAIILFMAVVLGFFLSLPHVVNGPRQE
jgi:hypothetical protein